MPALAMEPSLRLTSPSADRNLWLGIGFSVLLHAAVLSLHFAYPDAERVLRDKALDIILVNSKSLRKPPRAQALAQNNLDGGGNTDDDRRAKSPLPPAPKNKAGSELEQTQKRIQAAEARQQRLLAEARSKNLVAPAAASEAQPEPVAAPSGRDLASNALAMARLEAEIARNVDDYNKRPRKRNIGTSTKEYRFTQYVENWRQKVERIGTLNYPEAARGKLYGTLILTLTIKSDGTVDKVEIDRSSGHKVLDDAARRIVMMAGAAPFPPNIQSDTDILEITRSWKFTSGNTLETSP